MSQKSKVKMSNSRILYAYELRIREGSQGVTFSATGTREIAFQARK